MRASFVAALSLATLVVLGSNSSSLADPAPPPDYFTWDVQPWITGDTSVGSTLTAHEGHVQPEYPYTYHYRFIECTPPGNACSTVLSDPPSASSTYTIPARDAGCVFRVWVYASTGSTERWTGSEPTTTPVPGGPCDPFGTSTGGGGSTGGGSGSGGSPPNQPTSRPFTAKDATLPEAVAGSPIDVPLIDGEGTPPYILILTNSYLPRGILFRASDAHLVGTPTESGSFVFAASITDSQSHDAAQVFRWVIHPSARAPASTSTFHLAAFTSCLRLSDGLFTGAPQAYTIAYSSASDPNLAFAIVVTVQGRVPDRVGAVFASRRRAWVDRRGAVKIRGFGPVARRGDRLATPARRVALATHVRSVERGCLAKAVRP